MRRLRQRNGDERGANLVEFAVALPLLLLMLFGIIEFGWAFAQNLEVKHIAREVGRLATVDADEAEIESRTCGGTIAQVKSANPAGGNSPGDTVTVTVVADLQQITGFFAWALGSVSNLQSAVEIRLEQPRTWSGTTCP